MRIQGPNAPQAGSPLGVFNILTAFQGGELFEVFGTSQALAFVTLQTLAAALQAELPAPVTKTASFTITPGVTIYRCNTTAAPIVVAPPPFPTDGETHLIQDAYGAASPESPITFSGMLNGAMGQTLVQVPWGWHWITFNATTNQWGYSG